MTTIQWDEVGARTYENGLDRGVLYLPDGTAVPWNGLVSVSESINEDSSPVYYEGRKINALVGLGSFSASMRAITYPDEFLELEGSAAFRANVDVGHQMPKTFGLSYRTRVSNDLNVDAGHKIHVLYNVTARPQDKEYATLSDSFELTEFEWDISAIPEEIPNFAPIAHVIINTSGMEPWLIAVIEEKLYGSATVDATLPPVNELLAFIEYWTSAIIVDNGDTTTTILSDNPTLVTMIQNQEVDLDKLNIIYLSETSLAVSAGYKPSYRLISVTDNEDGTWTAETDADILFDVDINDQFTILHADETYVNPDTYVLSDTDV